MTIDEREVKRKQRILEWFLLAEPSLFKSGICGK